MQMTGQSFRGTQVTINLRSGGCTMSDTTLSPATAAGDREYLWFALLLLIVLLTSAGHSNGLRDQPVGETVADAR
jgi:hypothetical protein